MREFNAVSSYIVLSKYAELFFSLKSFIYAIAFLRVPFRTLLFAEGKKKKEKNKYIVRSQFLESVYIV